MRVLVRFVSVVALTCTVSLASEPPQQWSLEDSVELAYFMLPNELRAVTLAVNEAKPVISPDGKLFYVVTEKGNVAENINTTELRIFAVADVIAALKQSGSGVPTPRARHVARSRIANSFDPGIKDITWTEDSAALLFLEYGVDTPAQLRRLSVGADIETLSYAPSGVVQYELQGKQLIYTAAMGSRRADVSDVVKYPFSYVRDKDWFAAQQFTIYTYSTYIRRADGMTIQASRESQGLELNAYPSPDGRWVIIKKRGVPLNELPDWARNMVEDSGRRHIMIEYFYLRDLRQPVESERLLGLSGSLFDRIGLSSVLWAPDAARAILINAVVPDAEGVTQPITEPNLIELDIGTDSMRVIGDMPPPRTSNALPLAVTARWVKPGKSFALVPLWISSGDTYVHTLHGNRWTLRKIPLDERKSGGGHGSEFPFGLNVQIRQGLNELPRLVASRNGSEVTLWEPNGALVKKQLHRIERIEWIDVDGNTWDGHLVLPRGPVPSKGFPLALVMAHETYPNHFMPDGYAYAPGNAAQEMASNGIAQLALNAGNPIAKALLATRQEGPALVAAADSAVDELARRGLVDPERVGVIGYSRMGWATLYLSTHHRRFVPAAAIVQDSVDTSYVQYIQSATMGEVRPLDSLRMYTDEPSTFWDNKEAWMDAPGFMMDRMQSPLLVQHHYGPYIGGLLSIMEPYAAMRHLGRPVEAVAFNGGAHVHTQPAHRLASMQLAVDWMRFWLKDEENSSPENRERNAHWRRMRDKWKDRPAILGAKSESAASATAIAD